MEQALFLQAQSAHSAKIAHVYEMHYLLANLIEVCLITHNL